MSKAAFYACVLLLTATTLGCDEATENLAAEDAMPVLEGRSFAARLADPNLADQGLVRVQVGGVGADIADVCAAGDPRFVAVCRHIEQSCEREVGNRFDEAQVTPGPKYVRPRRESQCGFHDAELQQINLCIAHRFLGLSEAVVSTEFYQDGTIRPEHTDDSEPDPLEDVEPLYVVPAASTSDSATLALVGTKAFQAAALVGARALDPQMCTDGTLDATVMGGRRDELGGTSDAVSDRVSLGFVVASATAEALRMLDESARAAMTSIEGASRDKLADERDQREALVGAWRGKIDSRLEMANVLLGVPPRLFEPPASSDEEETPDPGTTPDPDDSVGDWTVCDTPEDGVPDIRAEELLRGLRINPAGIETDEIGFYDDVVAAMAEDEPTTLGEAATEAGDSVGFLDSLGYDTVAIRQAAIRLNTEAEVLGRPIVPDESTSGMMVPRVFGTQATAIAPDPAFLFATSTGSARFDDTTGWIDDGSSPTEATAGEVHAPPSTYATRSLLGTVDVVGSVLLEATQREDLDGDPSDGVQFSSAINVINAAKLFARVTVSKRMQVCIGQATDGELDQVRIRLYGSGTDDSRYDLWWGEAGLQCATRGNIEGAPCDPDDVRVNASSTVEMDGRDSGLGDAYVEWTVTSDVLPEGVDLSTEGRIYLTERLTSGPRGGERVALGGTGLSPGPTAGVTYSRCAVFPVGREVGAEVESALSPAPSDCSEPANTCAGLPLDLRLPLEDEISEAGEGADDIESSFLHYLRLARQSADEADALGEQLIEQGLQMDLRAEAARDELESICGGVVNVDSIPVGPPNECTCPAGTDECSDPPACGSTPCIGGVCQERNLSDYLASAEDDPDLDSVRRCLGGGGDLVDAALGGTPLCYYQLEDSSGDLLPPCDCGADECPQCPVLAQSDGMEGWTCAAAFSSPPISASAVHGPTTSIGLTDAKFGDGGPPECAELARLRNLGGDVENQLDEIAAQAWFSPAQVNSYSEFVGIDSDLFQFVVLTRGGDEWGATGFEETGPNEDRVWPCAPLLEDPLLSEICTGGEAQSLLCGLTSSCATGQERVHANRRLIEAVYALKALGGGRLSNIKLPLAHFTRLEVESGDRPFRTSVSALPEQEQCTAGPDACEISALTGRSDAVVRSCVAGLEFFTHCNTAAAAAGIAPSCSTASGTARCEGTTSLFELPAGRPPAWLGIRFPGVTAQIVPTDDGARCIEILSPPTTTDGMALRDFDATIGPYQCPIYHSRFPMRDIPTGRTPGSTLNDIWTTGPEAPPTSIRGLLIAAGTAAGDGVSPRSAFASSVTNVPLSEQMPRATATGRAYARLTNQAVLDGLELACLSATYSGGGCAADASELPPVTSINDFPALQRMLECAADGFESRIDRLMLLDVPEDVVRDLGSQSAAPGFSGHRGAYGETVKQLRASLEQFDRSAKNVAATLRNFSFDLDSARSQIKIIGLEDDIRGYETISRLSAAAASCSSGITPSVGKGGVTGYIVNPVACIDALVQAAMALAISEARGAILDEEQRQVLRDIGRAFGDRMDMLDEQSRQLNEATAQTQELLLRLERLRTDAQRAAAKVLFLDRDDVGREYAVNRVMRARMNTLRERYERARRNAIRYSWIARRAIEQRFAVDMSTMSEDMTLVPPPATWADSVCTMSGIDYDELRDVDSDVDSFADGYIGDYVTLLENFVESYRFDYPFADGRDIALLSLRDNLLGVRRECDIQGPNHLLWSSDLSRPATGVSPGWTPECSGHCLLMSTTGDSPFYETSWAPEGATVPVELSRTLGGARAFLMEVTDPPPPSPTSDPPPDTTPYFPPAWTQTVAGVDGGYLLTWYEHLGASIATPTMEDTCRDATCAATCGTDADCLASCVNPRCLRDECAAVDVTDDTLLEVSVRGETEDVDLIVPSPGYLMAEPLLDACEWRRAYVWIENPIEQSIVIGFSPREAPDPMMDPPTVTWAAPQLETLPPAGMVASMGPAPFFPTGDTMFWPVGLCEDTDGTIFRSTRHWKRGCEYICTDGFGETCAGSDTPDRSLLRCFHEARFQIGLREIERGELVPTGAFALGNFNYRHGDLALNLVGTGVRDCSTAEFPSECYASGFIPYSIRHEGPYRVRNHEGQTYEAPLFTGNIEQAKALAAERYLTNPLSSADRSLLTDYFREEYRGRPLEGSYRLRVYDTPGLRWDRVEDVQIVLDYKYWTRFE